MKIVICTGGYDPLHSGHIKYFEEAKKLGDLLIVGVNSDAWLTRKKGRAFMPWLERATIVDNLKMVDYVYEFNDDDGPSKDAILRVRRDYPNADIIFANGGDRTKNNIPEMDVICSNIQFVFEVGGSNKANSSSWILDEWKAPKTVRQWGYYRILHTIDPTVKLKELTVEPGKKLSMQKHNLRSEFWFVAEGQAKVYKLDSAGKADLSCSLQLFQSMFIETGQWHQLVNDSEYPLRLIEIQYGDQCIEEDIQRLDL